MPLQATSGAASYDAFGGGAPAALPTYIEDVFSTWLYTGTGATQSINNGIDVTGKGALVWLKRRNSTNAHFLFDTARGVGTGSQALSSNTTGAGGAGADIGFSSTGFDLTQTGANTNGSGATYASWTFRKQPKFFDIVTYTTVSGAMTIPHSLGSTPGCWIIKATNATDSWWVHHRSIPTGLLRLEGTSASESSFSTATSTNISISTGVFSAGTQIVIYLFAHDAGGFGLTGTDNVISCGSYTGNDSTDGPIINLGYEPQWVMIKNATTGGGGYNWLMADNMRGIPMSGNTPLLKANLSDAEDGTGQGHAIEVTATGFQLKSPYGALNNSSNTYIYIAIRRGPMKVPTTGASVYENTAYTGNNTVERKIGSSVLTDLLLLSNRNATADSWASFGHYIFDRLRGQNVSLGTANTNAEVSGWDTYFNLDMNTGWDTGSTSDQVYLNKTSATYVSNAFRRAPSFMDVVCYTGNGTDPQTVSHNLGKAPELMIFKARAVTAGWRVWGGNMAITEYLALSETSAVVTGSTFFGSTLPTATSFYVGSGLSVTARTIVAYLFATCAGVSKVGSYTGTATTKQIDCGFTAGARFVLIKRTDSTGDWYVWDTARGIVAGNDSYLLLNSTAAEVTSTDYIDTYSAGFEISSTAPAAINANGGSFIFLAIS